MAEQPVIPEDTTNLINGIDSEKALRMLMDYFDQATKIEEKGETKRLKLTDTITLEDGTNIQALKLLSRLKRPLLLDMDNVLLDEEKRLNPDAKEAFQILEYGDVSIIIVTTSIRDHTKIRDQLTKAEINSNYIILTMDQWQESIPGVQEIADSTGKQIRAMRKDLDGLFPQIDKLPIIDDSSQVSLLREGSRMYPLVLEPFTDDSFGDDGSNYVGERLTLLEAVARVNALYGNPES